MPILKRYQLRVRLRVHFDGVQDFLTKQLEYAELAKDRERMSRTEQMDAPHFTQRFGIMGPYAQSSCWQKEILPH